MRGMLFLFSATLEGVLLLLNEYLTIIVIDGINKVKFSILHNEFNILENNALNALTSMIFVVVLILKLPS